MIVQPGQKVSDLVQGVAQLRAEVSKVTCVADVANSLAGLYFLLSSTAANFYCWLRAVAIAEVSKIVPTLDTLGSLNGLYWIISSTTVDYYVWYKVASIAEVSKIVPAADVAGSLNNKYFLISSKTVDYYVWFNVNAAGVDPAVATRTGIEVALATGATKATVAAAIETALDALGASAIFSAAVDGSNDVTITNLVVGAAAHDAGAGNSGFTATTPTQGITAASDPAVGGKTGIEVDITVGMTKAQVATATKTALDAVTGVFTTVKDGSNDLTMTNAVAGAATNAGAGTSGFTATTPTAGVNVVGADPNLASKTGLRADYATGATAAQIAIAVQTVIDAHASFLARYEGSVCEFWNATGGAATDGGAGTSTFTFERRVQGHGVGTYEPGPATNPKDISNAPSTVSPLT